MDNRSPGLKYDLGIKICLNISYSIQLLWTYKYNVILMVLVVDNTDINANTHCVSPCVLTGKLVLALSCSYEMPLAMI